ncbi:secondary thiamine-phosphate synthase enzyme YjbQ [Salinarchaeum sp. IM2453]|uniref:secondary thiamine-phosphate synthase enzyme YjbQ n=1 Tax=Salinarchaeum sp. IM2453 TaxID=2862870 RepID=UPI001C82ED29|nr:secondary thiamine-phosphate synthase enzyme YjbQ [Salinarchaeum sp. IM2453]QZA89178.1 secondary thiamine-phosphate synthase enzyme YjbQ [Salinarchaeum sp. IM2453]
MPQLTIESSNRMETIDITDDVAAAIPESVTDGICSVYVTHTTAAVTVNENESGLRTDTESFLHDLVPSAGHKHDTIDNNADSHLRATLIGPDVTVPVRDGSLALGTWGSILFFDFDGPRRRTIEVTVVEK